MWLKQSSSEDFRHYHFDRCSQVYKKYLKDKKKCEEGNWKCNMENVPKINIWNLNTKYHTTTAHTKYHMKIHTMENPYHYCLCAKKIHLQEPQEESCQRKSEPLCTVWKGSHIKKPLKKRHIQGLLSRVYITVLCVAKNLYPGTTQRNT